MEGRGIDSAGFVPIARIWLFLDKVADNKWLTHPAIQIFGLSVRLHSFEMTVPLISGVFILDEGLQQLTQLACSYMLQPLHFHAVEFL